MYYSGHMPSVLRMNRTSSEFAVAVIFDGLLMSAIHFTDVHEASRQACCEDELISYLLEEIVPHLNGIQWGKVMSYPCALSEDIPTNLDLSLRDPRWKGAEGLPEGNIHVAPARSLLGCVPGYGAGLLM